MVRALDRVKDGFAMARGALALASVKQLGEPSAAHLLGGAGAYVESSDDYERHISRDRLRRLYAASSWVYTAATAKANVLMRAEGRVVRDMPDGGTDRVPDHPFMRIWRNPNPVYTTAELQFQRSVDLDLAGHAFWYIMLDGLFEPAQIWPLDPLRTRPVLGNEGIDHYRYEGDRGTFHLPAAVVCHFRNYSPDHPLDGVPTVRPIFAEALGDIGARAYYARFQGEALRPQSAFTTESEMDPDEAREMSKELQAAYGGSRNAGRPLVLWSGLKPIRVAFTPAEADLIAGRGVSRDAILAGFGISKASLGITDDANRATIEGLEYALARRVAEPALMKVQQRITASILSLLYQDDDVRFEFPDVVPVDEDRRIRKVAALGALGSITRDEAREELIPSLGGLAEGGDEIAQRGGARQLPAGTPAGPERMAAESGDAATRAIKQGVRLDTNDEDEELRAAMSEHFRAQRSELLTYLHAVREEDRDD